MTDRPRIPVLWFTASGSDSAVHPIEVHPRFPGEPGFHIEVHPMTSERGELRAKSNELTARNEQRFQELLAKLRIPHDQISKLNQPGDGKP